uniref:CSP domain-containing protein n=1 Tax=Mesocestoides corti TaxID=53468 RepID=A0A5K3EIP0_MESCO
MPDSGDHSSSIPPIPSPVIHRRNRTVSQCAKAAEAAEDEGVIESFCREKGHGFIKTDSGDTLFVHVFEYCRKSEK